jgi:hypothetical protein
MEAEGTLFIWKVVSVDSTTMRIGTGQIGTGQIGTGQTGTGQIGTGQTGTEGTWAIGTGRLASATILEGRRAQMGNGTLKVTFAESLRGCSSSNASMTCSSPPTCRCCNQPNSNSS